MPLPSRLSRTVPKHTILNPLFQRAYYPVQTRRGAIMATAYQVHVSPSDTGLLKFSQNDTTAAKVSELLQKDIKNHHVFFNSSGFHNHIVHHLLTLYGTGANTETLQNAYDTNASYQIHAKRPRSTIIEELQHDYAAAAPKYFGTGDHFAAFLSFFQSEIEKKGWKDVMREYLFGGTEVSHALCGRLYAGFLHPMIQLMFGVEWEQPAIIASAMAQAAVHEDKLSTFLGEAEKLAYSRNESGVPLPTLYENIRKQENDKLAHSARWEDPNRLYDGVMVRAPQEAMEYVSRIKVKDEELDERTAEMLHLSAYVAAASSWHPPHIPKFDFFLIHHLNSAPIFLSFNKIPWISRPIKVRLLEWKMRLDVIQYIARGCPPLHPEILKIYVPKDKIIVFKPAELLPRFHALSDDGHIIKVVRALLIAQEISAKYAHSSWIQVKKDDEWFRMHCLLLDGVEGQDTTWVRSSGFPEAWENVPKAK